MMSNIGSDAGEQMISGAVKIGTETLKLTGTVTKGIMDFIMQIIKIRNEQQKNAAHSEKDPLSKVKYGEIDLKNLLKLERKENIQMAHASFPAEDLERISELMPRYGGRFALVDISPSNTATVVFPENDKEAVFAAMKQVAMERSEEEKDSLKYKESVVSEGDMGITNTVLEGHDIPAYSFNAKNGQELYVVPAEHEQAFEAAISEAAVLKEQLKNIDIISFEQTQDLDNLDYVIDDLPATEAVALSQKLKNDHFAPNIKFAKDGDKITAIYSVNDKERVQALKDSYLSDRSAADDLLPEIIGNEISANKKTLLLSESSSQYFMRIPGTGAQKHIYLNKSEFSEQNGGITGRLNFTAVYAVCDKNGKQIGEMTGLELAEYYNGKSLHMNKDTKIAYSNTNSLEHIELYNAKKNELINLSLEHSTNVRNALISIRTQINI